MSNPANNMKSTITIGAIKLATAKEGAIELTHTHKAEAVFVKRKFKNKNHKNLSEFEFNPIIQ